MNLDHLYYFKTLVETKSRNDTARILSITQPTLSLALSKLEKELGVSLLEKKKGTVELTKDGKTFYEYVATSLQFLDNGVSLLREKQGAFDRTEISIGAIYSVQDENWSRIMYEFRRQTHGAIRINVRQSTTPGVLKYLKNGVVDVGFGGTMGPDPDINFFPCWGQEAVLAVNRLHPFSSRSEISLDELKDHYLISYNLKGPLGPELIALVKGHDLSIDYLYADEITLASIVAGNPDIMAIACHSWLLESYSNELELVKIVEAPRMFRQLYMSSRANIELSPVVQTFLDVAIAYCQNRSDECG
ncbi:LysR family transcriptional regulator [Eggerthella sp. YY7918]|uniref:LysR family transcriptional regulator n=1 Tax=Eggerthella sp. (strain YY7918) TaxID=502558 RepID=UPI00021712CB|nr:LysR family transcriptional regulator [Eggerthella sp. YY7918]BAK44208.1 hypothetical protein EGYY_10260 [Eggerthella sp. YY7918]